ncbi:biosynthetic-type acetolactate synthase large subunit [bacterium]|nr:biosynthetic-type acetolactate synthase large subunit [bacterium]
MTVLNKNIVDKQTLTGAKLIVETLKNLGIDSIFGYPGGIVLGLYDELYNQKDITHYLMRHEQSAVHAAEGYARVSGKCGVVLVTSGPGASNTVTGIANAYLDGYPLVVITGQVASDKLGKDAFQEVNIIDITKSCTKAGFQVRDINELENTLYKAFHIAMDGKKGPVVIDITKDVFNKTVKISGINPYKSTLNTISEQKVQNILNEISKASNPVIVAGGGVAHSKAYKDLKSLVKRLNIPVVSTMMGLGAFNKNDKNYLGMIGIFGQKSANTVLKNSDLILSLGARFNDRITCCFKTEELSRKFIQVDINEKEISRNIPAYDYIVGDIKEFLTIANRITVSGRNDMDFGKYRALNKPNHGISNRIQSFEVIEAISEYTKDFAPVITTEVGQHQLWTAQNYDFSYAGQFITSGGLGTMGFGLPAAIGASIALGRKPVICISGDGSFQMNEQELAVCADYNLPIKIFIMNNGYLGMVRQLQQNNCEGRYSQTKISNPDFIKLAEAYGIPAITVNKKEDINQAIKKSFEISTSYIINFMIESMEEV